MWLVVGGVITLLLLVGCIVVNGAALAPLLVGYWGGVVFLVGGVCFCRCYCVLVSGMNRLL